MGKSVSTFQLDQIEGVADMRLSSEAWRYIGPFSRYNRFKGALPGLGTATVAFAVYCGYEYMFLQDSHQGHGESPHGGSHH